MVTQYQMKRIQPSASVLDGDDCPRHTGLRQIAPVHNNEEKFAIRIASGYLHAANKAQYPRTGKSSENPFNHPDRA